MTPLQRYQQDLAQQVIREDAAQAKAVSALQHVYDQILQQHNAPWWQRLRKPKPVNGVYMWGGVGRGKTYLMDCFFEALPIEHKLRLHFYRFMERIHHDLRQLQGQVNPINQVAKQLAAEAQVLCFDEFVVIDIADAMILGLLFTALFEQGVTVITTSNVQPDDLYKGGLQRQQFLPAIEKIKHHTAVINVDSGVDYRVQEGDDTPRYFTPLKGQAAQMKKQFQQLAGQPIGDKTFTLAGRSVAINAVNDKAIWFEFDVICTEPRSASDYIALAKQFKTVLVSNVPKMRDKQNDEARRFIALVDEFYDAGVELILSAAVPIAELYQGERLDFEFARTVSRLNEMQS